MVLYAFFAGYLVTQVPGGYTAEVASVTWVLGLGVGLTSFLTCLTSVAARFDYYALISLRVAEGITEVGNYYVQPRLCSMVVHCLRDIRQ